MYLVAQRKREKFGRLSIKYGCRFTTDMAVLRLSGPQKQTYDNLYENANPSTDFLNMTRLRMRHRKILRFLPDYSE
jgi:uncharacterized protein YbcI